MTRVAFSPKVLESYGEFERYLESKETIERIREETKKPYVPGEGRLGALSVTWLTVTFPLRGFYGLFLRAMGNLLYYASPFSNLGLYLYVEGELQEYYADYPLNYLFSPAEMLVDSRNDYSHDAYEIYTQEPIKLDEISLDGQVRDHINPKRIDEQNRLTLTGWNGQCSGMSDWVAYLYRETKYDFDDPEHHLVSVIKQVRNGASRESALLQAAQRYDERPLGLSHYIIDDLVHPEAEEVQDVFKSLSSGLYSVTTKDKKEDKSGHRMNVIVTRQNTYLFDPNSGLHKTSPEKLGKCFADLYQVLIADI